MQTDWMDKIIESYNFGNVGTVNPAQTAPAPIAPQIDWDNLQINPTQASGFSAGFTQGPADINALGIPSQGVAGGAVSGMEQDPGFFDGLFDDFFGGTDTKTGMKTNGWGSDAFNIGSAAMNMWNGYQQNKRADEMFEFKKDAFSKQFENQRKTTNLALGDKYEGRMSARSPQQRAKALSREEYVKQYGV